MTSGKLSVIVLGSIGYGGMDSIKSMYDVLEREGFDVVKHVMEKGMDYTEITDFRNEKDLSKEICEHDLSYLKEAKVMVILGGKASWGGGMQLYEGKINLGLTTVLLAPDPVPTPWPINFSDYIVRSEEELIKTLHEIEKG